jgi:hypothetical protein
MQYDVWAVSPDSDDDYFFASAVIATTGVVSLALLANDVGQYGTGYKLSVTSDGADSATVFTVTGVQVGINGSDGVVTESFTGPSASVAYSSNYYTRIDSVSVVGPTGGGIKVGFGGDLAFPRTRIKGVLYIATSAEGSITFTAEPNNTTILKVYTPGDSTANDAMIPPEGILTTKSNSGRGDIAVMTLDQVSKVTVICG